MALDPSRLKAIPLFEKFSEEELRQIAPFAAEASAEGWAKLPWDAVRGEGEATLAEDAVTVRCLQRPDGSVPEADDEPGVVAFVGRSY